MNPGDLVMVRTWTNDSTTGVFVESFGIIVQEITDLYSPRDGFDVYVLKKGEVEFFRREWIHRCPQDPQLLK